MKMTKKILSFFISTNILILLLIMAAQLMSIPHHISLIGIPLIIITIGFIYTRHITKPLQQLCEVAQMIRSGNLNHDIRIETQDEIESLYRVIMILGKDLQETRESLYGDPNNKLNPKKNTRKLEKSEEYFHRIFEFANDPVFIYDFDGQIRDVNKKACDMLGFTRKELKAKLFLDLQVEEEVIRTKAALKTSAKTGSIKYESQFKKTDRESIDVEVSTSIIDLKSGIMQSIVSNITERKISERNLKDSEEKFRTFMETASDLMFISDKMGSLIYVNDAMIRILGYSKEDLIGSPFHDLLDKESLEESKSRRQNLIEEGEDLHELIWITKTNKKLYGEMKVVAIYDPDGHFQGIRGVFRDMTERKKIESSQRLSELGKLTADIAHEVKNQLAIVYTRAQLALMHLNKNKDVKEDLNIIVGQCDHVNDVVKRLLMFSKPSEGEFKEVSINNSLDFVIRMIEKQYRVRQVEIYKYYGDNLPKLCVDEKQLQEVFINLLGNAFEAMPSGGTITISTEKIIDYVQLTFTDTGDGISESDLQQIFNPFFTTKEDGTGLGLSVCYGIIQAHQGELKYTSTKSKGTTATILLPIESSG